MVEQSISRLVFVTCGTHEDGFGRMRSVVTHLADNHFKVLFQHGHTDPVHHEHVINEEWLEHLEMQGIIRDAYAVLTHAGTGSIMSTLRLGRRPIVFPRSKKWGEHIDDHQFEIAHAMRAKGLVDVVFPGDEMGVPTLVKSREWNQTPYETPRNPIYDIIKKEVNKSFFTKSS